MGDGADDAFGPHLPGVFDFTVLFEQTVLSLLPTCLFVVLAPFRVCALLRHGDRVRPGPHLWAKLAAAAAYLALRVALVALWSLSPAPRTRTSLAEAAVGILEAVAIAATSYAEHRKSIKPAALLNGYLLLSVVLGIAPARTYWLRPGLRGGVAGAYTASLAVKALLLVLEEAPKKRLVADDGKDAAPETVAGVVSRGVFWWLNSLLFTGARALLGVDDIGTIQRKFDSRRLLGQLEQVWDRDPKSGRWSLMKCTFLAYKWQFVAGMAPRLLFAGFTFAQPFLINAVVDFVGAERPEDVAGSLVGATALVYVGMAVSNALYKHMTFQLLTMYRGGLASLVFKKTLALRSASVREAAPVTLMSTDIEAIVMAGDAIHDIWASVVEIPIAIYMLYRHVGVPSLFILIPGFITSAAGALISPAMGPARVKWNKAIQERVGSVSSMLGQIKGVKMMGLTDFFHDLLRRLRADELKLSVSFRWILIQLNAMAMASEDLTPVIIILAAIFWTKADQGLTVAEAFTSLSIISIAAAPLVNILISIVQLFGAIGCFTRLQAFLLLDERKDPREMVPSPSHTTPSPSHRSSRLLADESSKLPPSTTDVELDTLHEAEDSLTAKASIAAVIIEDASFVVDEEVEVLHDIDMAFPAGAISMVVGRVGCGKSSLLRAIAGELAMAKGRIATNVSSMAYCDQAPWLQNVTIRDNILGQSPLDEKWLKTVIEACALDEDISQFPLGDLTIVGSGGVSLSGGQKQRAALARAVYSRRSLLLLDDVFSGLDNTTSRAVFQRLMGSDGLLRKSKATVILATNHVHFLPAADCITMLQQGRVLHNQVPYDSVDPSEWGVLDSDSDTSTTVSEPDEEMGEEKARISHREVAGPARKTEADLSRQTGDFDCYKIYLRSIGMVTLAVLVVMSVAHIAMNKMPQVWLRLWTEQGTGPRDLGYMGGYIGFALASTVTGAFNIGYFVVVGVPRSANRLHDMLLNTVVRAPFYFFTSTDSGITLNRFSQDMTLIDNALPLAFLNVAVLSLRALAETGLIASGASYVGAAIPVCFVALYFVQKYYLRTSRQMRFLDLEMKSPLYTQFTETLAGLSTIRAFGWSGAFLRDNHARLDTSQKPFYTMFCIQRWLQVVLDLFVAGLALVLVALALHLPAAAGGASKGSVGLAMVNLIGFNQTLTLVIDQWTRLETSLGAIARLKWFMSNTPDENRGEEREEPASDWPAQGAIELRDVVASYSDETEPVLRGVSLTIRPGQKVGICGRSGSGKSSLILTLARLLDLRSGSITIDGHSLSVLPRQTIRSRLTTLPQDAVQLAGSVRHNLDPRGLVQADAPLEAVLRKTAVWPAVAARGGLEADMHGLGLSAGQLQLFCLARALLSRGAVVLLDEATSSVDRQTDDEVRRVVREEMRGRTVVEVAHRLELVRGCDLVVVMSEGRVQEAGHPDELLGRPSSAFRALWESQGL